MTHSSSGVRHLRLRRLWRRSRWLVGVCVTCMLASTAPASAEVVLTTQGRAAHASWLVFAPPPDAGPMRLCVVDSGMDLNADVRDVVVARVALDGGTLDDVDPRRHGTSMGMVAGAALNGLGMVGIWPRVQIVSVRAADPPAPGQRATFEFREYVRAVRVCLGIERVAVIVLALGGGPPASAAETATLVDSVVKAHAKNVSIVAAAGNNGGPVGTPASLPGVLAVGAGDARGVLCSLSARGPGLDLIAPGCNLDTAHPQTLDQLVGASGTSQAAVAAATAGLAALRSYRPDLSWEASEQLLRTTAVNGVLDVEAAFRAAGLGSIVDSGRDAMARAGLQEAPAGQLGPPAPSTQLARFARPRVRSARCAGGLLVLRLARRPTGSLLEVQLGVRGAATGPRVQVLGRVRRKSVRLRLSLPNACPERLRVRFTDRYGERRSRSTLVGTRTE